MIQNTKTKSVWNWFTVRSTTGKELCHTIFENAALKIWQNNPGSKLSSVSR